MRSLTLWSTDGTLVKRRVVCPGVKYDRLSTPNGDGKYQLPEADSTAWRVSRGQVGQGARAKGAVGTCPAATVVHDRFRGAVIGPCFSTGEEAYRSRLDTGSPVFSMVGLKAGCLCIRCAGTKNPSTDSTRREPGHSIRMSRFSPPIINLTLFVFLTPFVFLPAAARGQRNNRRPRKWPRRMLHPERFHSGHDAD